jgi:hypothetical protein
MARNNKGGKKGRQERKQKADSRQAFREHGCQNGDCKAIATIFIQKQNGFVRLCPAHARQHGYCQTCCKKKGAEMLEEGTCPACWAKMRLGVNQGQEVVVA